MLLFAFAKFSTLASRLHCSPSDDFAVPELRKTEVQHNWVLRFFRSKDRPAFNHFFDHAWAHIHMCIQVCFGLFPRRLQEAAAQAARIRKDKVLAPRVRGSWCCKGEAQPLTPTNVLSPKALSPDRSPRRCLDATGGLHGGPERGEREGDAKGRTGKRGTGKHLEVSGTSMASASEFPAALYPGKSACLLQEDDTAGTRHECFSKPFVLARAPHPAVRRPWHRRWQSKGMFVLDCVVSVSAGRAGCLQGGGCR